MIKSQIRTASAFLLGTLAALAAIYFALTRTNNETYVGVLILLFIFVGMPCLLFAIRGIFVALRRSPSSPRARVSVLVHVCAMFGALVGAGIYSLGRAYDGPSASRQAWLIIIFPAIIYGIKLTIEIVAGLVKLIIRAYHPSSAGI
jgi:hypothetical protein